MQHTSSVANLHLATPYRLLSARLVAIFIGDRLVIYWSKSFDRREDNAEML
jgi:hypothetical protein